MKLTTVHCGSAIRLIALVKTEHTIQAMLRGMGIQQVFHSPDPPEAFVSQTTQYEKEDLEWNEEAKDALGMLKRDATLRGRGGVCLDLKREALKGVEGRNLCREKWGTYSETRGMIS